MKKLALQTPNTNCSGTIKIRVLLNILSLAIATTKPVNSQQQDSTAFDIIPGEVTRTPESVTT